MERKINFRIFSGLDEKETTVPDQNLLELIPMEELMNSFVTTENRPNERNFW